MAESPFYRFMRRFDYPLDWRTWERLPRIPGYKNEYWDGRAHLTPRPATVDSHLDLTRPLPPPRPSRWSRPPTSSHFKVRRLNDEDWHALPDVFLHAFCNQQPLAAWNEHAATRASRVMMEWTRLGREGPLLPKACVVATLASDEHDDGDARERIVGAAIVTLAKSFERDGETTSPRQRRQMPHLTWIFVQSWFQRHGIGNAMLDAVVEELRRQQQPMLASTCLAFNAASLLWHWRHGFVPDTSWCYA